MGLDRDDALAIAKKLGATIVKKRRAHDLAQIWHGEKIIAMFGIRRGRRDLGHGHVPNKLFLTPHQARELANCPMSRADWLSRMSELGKLV